MTAADDLTPTWAEMRAILAEQFHADHYQVMRREEVPDGYGGTTMGEPEPVETGRCTLDLTGRLGSENIRGGVPTAVSTYTAELPIDSIVEETDTLDINGRTFEVVSVARGGAHDLFTTVGLEERS